MRIRRATKNDVKSVAEVLFAGGLGKSLQDSRQMFLKELKRGDRYLIAEEKGKALGIVSWVFQGAYRHELAELYHICVIPELKGKGVAEKLFQALIEDINKIYAKEGHKLRKLYLVTHADNHRAQGFYKKVGMVHEATLKDHFYKGKDEFFFAYYP